MATRRSIWADRLAEFPDFAFGDVAVFAHRGRWREFFGHRIGAKYDGRVIFEIGCSDAGFIARIATRSPQTGFVGLDWKCKSLYDGARRVGESGLRNVALLRGRGQDIARIFAEAEVDEIWVFHPDPCDREVERKNRLLAEPFLCDAHRVMREGSVLALKTDHAEYYRGTAALLESPGDRFEVTMRSEDYWNDAAAIAHTSLRLFAGGLTLFESRFRRKRAPIYYIEMRKRSYG